MTAGTRVSAVLFLCTISRAPRPRVTMLIVQRSTTSSRFWNLMINPEKLRHLGPLADVRALLHARATHS